VEEKTLAVQWGMEQVLAASDCELLQLIVIKSDFNRSVNKFTHPIQSPLLLVTEPRTRDNIYIVVWRLGAVV
jgi:hypothetical protein